LGGTLLLGGTVEASACDELITRLIEKAIRPAIESLDCGELGKAGIDKSEHHLESVCYTSSGPSSQIEIVVDLKCKTGDNALFKTEATERVTAEAEVRGSDCQIEKIDFSAGGEVGKLLLRAFDANGKAREALQQALARAC
jgi:hypothetical protein